jgi:hypothetical protein
MEGESASLHRALHERFERLRQRWAAASDQERAEILSEAQRLTALMIDSLPVPRNPPTPIAVEPSSRPKKPQNLR